MHRRSFMITAAGGLVVPRVFPDFTREPRPEARPELSMKGLEYTRVKIAFLNGRIVERFRDLGDVRLDTHRITSDAAHLIFLIPSLIESSFEERELAVTEPEHFGIGILRWTIFYKGDFCFGPKRSSVDFDRIYKDARDNRPKIN